jgi:ferric-dicitrate binding protein FerR (iron transport regulator)
MMDFNPIEIHDLTLDEIAGLITDAEREYLYQVIAENEEAFTIWQSLHRTLGPQQLQEARESMRAAEPQEIIHAHKKHIRKKRFLKTAGAAAILTILAGGWLFFLRSDHQPDTRPMAANPTKHIRLKLANGQTVDLSAAGQKIQLDEMTLTSANNTLQYSSNAPDGGQSELTVPAGKDYNIVLSDGTEIQLNSATTLRFPMRFSGRSREVSIDGEAYLKVAPKAGQPFIVHLPQGSVRVLGTSFNVNSYKAGTVKVALVDGAVSVKAGKDSTLLQPGFEIVAAQGKDIQVDSFDMDRVLSWRKGVYGFWETSLKEVCEVLPRWYGIDVVMDNEAVGKRSFTGAIDRKKPLSAFLTNISASDEMIHHYFDEKGVLHFK